MHALDELDDSERRRFMAARTGLVCVSYRLPKARAAMFGATMAAGMIAGAVMAGQERTAPPETGAVPEDEMIIIVVGGVSKAEHASWVDDSGLPDLPVIVETGEPDAVLPLKDPAPRR
ncbi:MAG: hypothetical protein J0L88_10910 [Xanthomonadales bacterium]|nr:hypothetical protein [Xanthomonadales bacterium]